MAIIPNTSLAPSKTNAATKGDSGRYRVNIRDTGHFKGMTKPEARQLDGKVFYFTVGWVIEPGEFDLPIAGEYAMMPHDDNWPYDAPTWIASGDLQLIGENDT